MATEASFFSSDEDNPMTEDATFSETSDPRLSVSKEPKRSVAAAAGGGRGGSGGGDGGGHAAKRQRASTVQPTATETGATGDAEENVEASAFRMNAKTFWLTYSGLYRGELDHQRILAMLLSKGTVAEYSIGRERHKEESVGDPDKDEHFHVYVAFENKKNIKSPRYFDMLGDGTYGSRRLHCAIMSCKTKQDRINRINYTMKEDANPLQKLNGPLGGAMSKQETFHELNKMVAEGSTVDECMAMMRENQPEEFFKFGDRVEARLEKLLQRGGDDKQFTLAQYRGIGPHIGIGPHESPRLVLTHPKSNSLESSDV
jgi:hypothetical protein